MGRSKVFSITAKSGYIEIRYGGCVIPIGCEFSRLIEDAFETADRLFYDKTANGFVYKVRVEDGTGEA